jgi:hypothetical protein
MYDPATGRFLQQDPLGLASGDLSLAAYAANNPVMFTDPSGLCKDPGGTGLRYCIETFIPFPSIAGFKGDDRGPQGNGGSYCTQQQIWQPNGTTQEKNVAGYSELELPFGRRLRRQAVTEDCSGSASGAMGARTIHVQCASANAFGFGVAPYIEYNLTLQEQGGCIDVSGYFTKFPSIEIWQYSETEPPKLVFFSDGSLNPLRLAPPIEDPRPWAPFLPRS